MFDHIVSVLSLVFSVAAVTISLRHARAGEDGNEIARRGVAAAKYRR